MLDQPLTTRQTLAEARRPGRPTCSREKRRLILSCGAIYQSQVSQGKFKMKAKLYDRIKLLVDINSEFRKKV